ncbi:chemotaxis protein CheR [Kineobactrum sediminis]|uniref:Chemotaxis protein methyltransferase n=1 Tax=Kineobactrum sediminis TaxID=1905677 RepID=A0A2N5Y7R6_9GAMM|nr:chemotaxis protein CheR [Kineobactrum sediminis]
MTDKNFLFVKRFIAEQAGIELSEAKRNLVYGRLVRRVRALGLSSFDDYCLRLDSGDSQELEHCVNALTTNLTSFFREVHHFDFLKNELLPRLINEKKDRRLRVWSAGCSTGEEPYSLAMVLAETMPADWDIRILGTDLDSQVVATGHAGQYTQERITGITEARRKRWFLRGKGASEGQVKVREELRDLTSFKRLNLLDPWPMKGSFDLVFCRNVVIYFSKDTQRTLFERFAEQLNSDGHLFIGHSETLYNVSDRFKLLGNTIYRKVR